jgi:hypothetical protein
MSTTTQTDASPVDTQTVPVLRAEIDTDAMPKYLAQYSTRIQEHVGMGRVTLERRGDDLFVNGRRVILHQSETQRKEGVRGRLLHEELMMKTVLNACFLEFLYENESFIPDSWKQDGDGCSLNIVFRGTIYGRDFGGEFVQFIRHDAGAGVVPEGWIVSSIKIAGLVGNRVPTAMLE